MGQNFLLKHADFRKDDSAAITFRRKRFGLFLDLVNGLAGSEVDILDVGGTPDFWKRMHAQSKKTLNITILNPEPQPGSPGTVRVIMGDGRDLSRFSNGTFDIVFSNSVIEHVGTYGDQKELAAEVRRVGKNYFVQTPNYYFPIEPHFLFPCFQFLPVAYRAFLLSHFDMGWYKKTRNSVEAIKAVEQIRLLKASELKVLFPDAKIFHEKFMGMTKSFVAYRF